MLSVKAEMLTDRIIALLVIATSMQTSEREMYGYKKRDNVTSNA